MLSLIPNANAQGPQSPTSLTKVFIAPSNTTDLTKTSGNFMVDVNVTDAPSINAFEVIIHYNNTALHATSLDYSTSVLGSEAKVVIYCVDGTAPAPLYCDSRYSANGEIALSLNLLSGSTGNITSAKTLFQVKFVVASAGLSQIHIYSTSLGLVVPSKVPLADHVFNTFDGFFTNSACGSAACQPPVVRVSSQPNPAPKDSVVTFNVTVIEPNVGAKALSYRWDWGDGTQADRQTNSTVVPIARPITHQFLSSRFGLATQCVNNGLCLVELTVYDSRGVSWEITIRVQILVLNIVLTVGDPDIKPQFHVLPGTPVKVNVLIHNPGNVAENATLTVRLEKTKTLNSSYFPQLAASGGEGSLSATLDTSGLAPRAYAIVAEITNTSSSQPIQGKIIHSLNATSQTVATSYVLIISPIITGALSLSILQTTGLGILILVAVVIALARFLKKPSYLEPL